MLTEWIRMWRGPTGRQAPQIQSNHAPFQSASSYRCPGRGNAVASADPAFAQSADPKAGEKPQAGDSKDAQKKVDEFAEAERLLAGPAANPECLWLGRRVVSLLWRDDLDTAFRHLDLYDRFGCPAGHIQATFRCVVRQGNIDPKATDTLNSRVHACWINPSAEAQGHGGGAQRHHQPLICTNVQTCTALSCTAVQNDCLNSSGTFFLLRRCFP